MKMKTRIFSVELGQQKKVKFDSGFALQIMKVVVTEKICFENGKGKKIEQLGIIKPFGHGKMTLLKLQSRQGEDPLD